MAILTIRNLDDATKAQLRLQAARHGRAMEAEVRTILREAVAGGTSTPTLRGLGSRIQAHFAHLGGVELELPERTSIAQPAGFEGGEAAK